MIEVKLLLVVPPGEDALQVHFIRRVFGHFFGTTDGDSDELERRAVCALVDAIESALAFAAGLDEFGVLQQTKMGGDARLAHVGDLLKFVDGKLVLLQQGDDAQTRGIGERPQ